MGFQTTTLFPLGVMAGGPNGSDPAAQARFEAQFTSFTQLMGATPQFMDGFIDGRQAVTSWASNASWTAWSWAQSPLARTMTPVIGLPMATEADRGHPGAIYKAFAAGQYDDALRGIVTAWAEQGFKTLYFRPGYEMNVPQMAWYAGDDAQTRADWVAAFRHIADVLHTAPGANVKVIWNPNVQSWNGTMDVKTLYPGDSYVDVVGADVYSPVYPRDYYDWTRNDGTADPSFAAWVADPVNRAHYWDLPAANRWTSNDGQGNSFSLQDAIDLAKAHGKPLGIVETGAGGDGNQGPRDDPAFAPWLAAKLAGSGVDVAMVNIWDLDAGDADWTFSGVGASRPLEAAAWAKAFGAGSVNTFPVTAGTGPDSIVLTVSEDAWNGDAQFTATVDGVQVGGVLTAKAAHGAGQSQAVTLKGSFGAGVHSVAVNFLNDSWGGSAATDRNLYVDRVAYAGATTAGAMLAGNGVKAFSVGVPVIAGPNSIVLRVSEDAWAGDAQFTASVDGVRVGGIMTATASHGAGQSQAITLPGSFVAGPHSVAITFLNDAWGGSAATDRNLYVDGVTFAGTTAPGAALFGNGTQAFKVGSALPGPVSVGSGSDTIVLKMSEDAWSGDAQFTASVDGKQIGGVLTATTPHGAGASQAFNLQGNFGVGSHTVTVNFTNDAWGGSAATDRNLYVDSLGSGSATTAIGAGLFSNGARSFTVTISAATVTASAMVFIPPPATTLSATPAIGLATTPALAMMASPVPYSVMGGALVPPPSALVGVVPTTSAAPLVMLMPAV